MDADLIDFETMLATQASAKWALGAMIASAISAITTVCTLFYARRAVNTWVKQEELKVKIDFKLSVIELSNAINAMPHNWSYIHVNLARGLINKGEVTPHRQKEVEIFYLKQDMASANSAALKRWMMCDSLFKGTEIAKEWEKFQHAYHHFAMRGGSKSEILPMLEAIVKKMIIF